ncbi:MAG: pyruvate kinase [Acidobacteria bacterium]|nr:pyruvate kinase [Acidobacteriota bacterium]
MLNECASIRQDMVRLTDDSLDLLEDIHPQHQFSARNLLHYLALRSHDLRPLQARLAAMGLSSLGRAESNVLAALDAVCLVLQRLSAPRGSVAPVALDYADAAAGQRLLDTHTEAVLGPRPAGRGVAIMVTMPSEAADDYTLVDDLLRAGMDCMRINCAHDGPDEWGRMIEHLQRAKAHHGRSCRIIMDLAGPKVRTGPLEPGPAVVKFKPQRDAFGRVVTPAHVWLYPEEEPKRASPTPCDASLPVPGSWLRSLVRGDLVQFVDTRGASRALRVVAVDTEGCWLESDDTCYIDSGTTLRVERKAVAEEESAATEATVGALPPREMTLALSIGDELLVTGSMTLGREAVRDAHGRVLTPATIGCSADQILADVRSGDRIWFDDGKIGGVVERREIDRLHVRITQARVQGARLAAEKGINLPDTALRLPALTEKDRADMAFVGRHADMVALSFVNSAEDVRELRSILESLEGEPPAIVLKIETLRGFTNLPAMLLEAMKSPRCAVMIARGDLAVECGFERMAELQEEILWLCEAAHVPVIWATQVLETLAKEGMPSRAEVTDAAMAHRAECVMLNKGPYIARAVTVLDDILRRMHGHQAKKRSMLRELQCVSGFRKRRAAHAAART